MDGKAIIWFSDRAGYRSHGSWGAYYDVYALFLDPEAYDDFKMSKEEAALAKEEKALQKKEEEKNKKDDKKGKKDDKKEDKKDSKKEEVKLPELKMNLDNLEDRIVRLTINSSNLGDAVLTKDSNQIILPDQLRRRIRFVGSRLQRRQHQNIGQAEQMGRFSGNGQGR